MVCCSIPSQKEYNGIKDPKDWNILQKELLETEYWARWTFNLTSYMLSQMYFIFSVLSIKSKQLFKVPSFSFM